MGHLNQPLNTFWQLLFRPSGSLRWVDDVESTAVGTNGGIVLASSNGQSIVEAVLPSNLLTFSPLLVSTNSGKSWTNGLVSPGLAPHPDSLSTSHGRSLALIQSHDESVVEVSEGQLRTWTRLTSQSALQPLAATDSCDLGALTAVAVVSGVDYVGGVCPRSTRMALFSDSGGQWINVTSPSPDGATGAFSEVLALAATNDGVSLLRLVNVDGTRDLQALWRSPSGRWTQSSALSLIGNTSVASFGQVEGRFFVVTDGTDGDRLSTTSTAGHEWIEYPPLPDGTQTVALGPTSLIQALVVHTGTLSVWTLSPTSADWSEGQVMQVPIPYGSAS
jgi:hypothetical protein